MKARLAAVICASVILAGISNTTNAATVTFQTNIDNSAGNYDSNGTHNDNNSEIGRYSDGTNLHDYRNYFMFNISPLAGQIVSSASLRVYNPSGGIFFVNPTETYQLYDVTTQLDTVRFATNSTFIWNDLGNGDQYGSVALSSADNNSWVEITLNANAINAINNPIGELFLSATNPSPTFALGGILAGGNGGFAFKNLHAGPFSIYKTELIVETVDTVVPIPAALWLFGSGLLGLIGMARRKAA